LAESDGHLLTDFLTWQDRRSTQQAADAAAVVDSRAYYRSTGGPIDASMWLPKLLWLGACRGELMATAGHVVTTQAFICRQLGADGWLTDWSTAAYSGLFNIDSRTWDEALVQTFGVPSRLLPPAAAPGTAVGMVSPAAADATGIPVGARLILAAADGICAELGSGVIDPGQLHCYLGTALSVAGPLEHRINDETRRLLIVPGSTQTRYRLLALGLAGASVLDWYASVTGHRVIDALDDLVARSEAGARGVMFIPALAGAGAPFWSADARGAFLGLAFGHSEADLVRAMLEGVAFECFWMIEALKPLGFAPKDVRISGGGSRSIAWTQIIADLLGVPVLVPEEADPGLRGAAAYALVDRGYHGDVLSAARAIETLASVREPSEAAQEMLLARARLHRVVREAFINAGLDRALVNPLGVDVVD
jgi:sugar (pentulose or hexulose) kinase